MGRVRNVMAARASRVRTCAASRHKAAMTSGERCRMIAAAERFWAERGHFDSEWEEQNLQETEEEIARFLNRLLQ